MRGRAASWILLCAAGAACGITPRTARPAPLQDIVERSEGPDLAVLPRPTAALRLSLWIDAGSRDADPPQVATLAAWLAAEAAGPEVHAWVAPDATELSMPCERSRLAACVRALSGALAHRNPDAAAISAARERLVRGRRLADAGTPGREADRVALGVLLGDTDAAGLFPLGRAQDDRRADAEGITAFLAEHYGPRRALLVAAGDADLDEVRGATEQVFRRLPPAGATRATREVPTDGGGVGVAVSEATQIAIAMRAPDAPRARALAARLSHVLSAPPARARVAAHAFAIRGGALVLARVTSRATPETVVGQVARELGTAAKVPNVDGEETTPEEGLAALSRAAGLRWGTRSEAAADASVAIAVGVLVRGARGDGSPERDPDAVVLERATQRLADVWRRAVGDAVETRDGEVGDARTSLHLDNGARLEIAWRPGPRVATALLFAGGASLDPPLAHGRTALLASLVARCAQTDGVTAAPVVSPDAWGVEVTTARDDWSAGLARAVGCVLDRSPTRAGLAAARLALRKTFDPVHAPASLRAIAAGMLAPAHPGALAPWGSPGGLRQAERAEIADAWKDAAVGRRASLTIVGEVPMREAAAQATRWLGGLPPGSRAPTPVQGPERLAPAAPPSEPAASTEPVLTVVAWRTRAPSPDPAGGRAFAIAMRALLHAEPDVEPVWHDGGSAVRHGWAAVAVYTPPEALAGLPARLRSVQARLDAATLAHAVDTTARAGARRRTDAAAGFADEASRLARAGLGVSPPVRARDRALDLAQRLTAATPRWHSVP